MRENDKGEKVDHRNMSDPIPERKDFIDHLKKNAPVDEDKLNESNRTGAKK